MYKLVVSTLALCVTPAVFGQGLAPHVQHAPAHSPARADGRCASGEVIWENGPAVGTALASQLDTNYPFHAQTADDFILPIGPAGQKHWSIEGMYWTGRYWGYWLGDGSPFDFDMRIIFYGDRGDGNAPTGGPDDPTPTALGVYDFDNSKVNETYIEPVQTYAYSVHLPKAFVAQANVKYWIVFQGVGWFPPQWGWVTTGAVTLHEAVQGFPLLHVPYWTNTRYDVSYRLLGAPIRPGDLNCDGEVNFGDINPFVQVLLDPAGWQAAYPDCPLLNGDINADGKVDFGDINPFVRLLTGP